MTLQNVTPKKHIRAILCDMSGVFIKGSLFSFLKKGYAYLQKPYTFIPPTVEIIPKAFFLGQMDSKCAFEQCFGMPLTDAQFAHLTKLWQSTWTLDSEVYQILRKVMVPISCVTNSDPLNFPIYQQKGYFDVFASVIASHEVHILKPDKAFFELAANSLGVSLDECLLIDDQERILQAVSQFVGSTHKFTSTAELESALHELALLDE